MAIQQADAAGDFCTFCDTVGADNTKHCKLCERCVIHMDHHCLFLMRCIAGRSHKLFVLFILLVNLSIILFLYSCLRYFSDIYHKETWDEFFSIMLTRHIFYSSLILLNLLSCIWGLALVYYQLKFISLGLTYVESLKNQGNNQGSRILTLSDRVINILYFLKGQKKPFKRIDLSV